jgi:hypothetical protein
MFFFKNYIVKFSTSSKFKNISKDKLEKIKKNNKKKKVNFGLKKRGKKHVKKKKTTVKNLHFLEYLLITTSARILTNMCDMMFHLKDSRENDM